MVGIGGRSERSSIIGFDLFLPLNSSSWLYEAVGNAGMLSNELFQLCLVEGSAEKGVASALDSLLP